MCETAPKTGLSRQEAGVSFEDAFHSEVSVAAISTFTGFQREFNMRRPLICFAVLTLLVSLANTSRADLSVYSQNFEGLNAGSSTALSGDGWLVFGNVFNPGGGYLYGYGPFGAPNGTPGFSSVATGEGGPNQGQQYINIYSDYNNTGEHNAGNFVEANTFQEQTIGAANVGQTWNFTFDFKASSTAGPGGAGTLTNAFIKVLDPNSGFATVLYNALNTTAASTTTWSEGNVLSVTILPQWVGGAQAHILQVGFNAKSTNFNPTGVFYDNLNFSQAIPEPGSAGLLALALAGLGLRRRR
jgi:PEP-CTERM motif